MNKRVYGVLGIATIMANWNADFSGYPKSTGSGHIYGSDKALKYSIKKIWVDEGKKVLYIKSLKFSKKGKQEEISFVPRNLKERYEYLFNVPDLKECKNVEEILKNLMTAVDVKNFGATFAESGCNIAITGAVQIGQGFNKYVDTNIEEQKILSPFRVDKGDEEAKSSTIGTKIVSDEAHYFYPFVINPMAYKSLVELGVTDGYTDKDYENFRRTALVSATAFATNAKLGCENEFAFFVETKPDVYLPNLAEYITFRKEREKNIISFHCNDLFEQMEDVIEKIEVYYNPYTTVLEGITEDMQVFDIRTQKEV